MMLNRKATKRFKAKATFVRLYPRLEHEELNLHAPGVFMP